ncbi:MAG TPA: hypothetical protein VGL99_24360, partial [Chloroflexota bacterium]
MNSEAEPGGEGVSAGIRVDGSVDSIVVHGDVAGRDVVHITAEQTYDVSDLSANPYRGLASFTYATRAFYSGREQQVAETIRLLTQSGERPVLVFVTGASGSGKSSFVQAGVLPALEAFYGDRLRWAVTRPGRQPMAAIQAALGQAQGDVTVLVIDQFEELFTQAPASEREQLCGWLSGLHAGDGLQVLATLRSDYLPAIFNEPPLLDAFKRDGIELRAMTPTELAQAIRQPLLEQARRDSREKRIQSALVERLVDDVGTEPTLLPLLQVTLTALWDQPPHTLTLDRYRSLTDALEQQAERAYAFNSLGKPRTADQKRAITSIFLDLVEVSLDDDPQRDVRRTVSKRELATGVPEREALINELVDARLLATTLDQQEHEQVDIIHETLLRNWARLRTAVHEARDALQMGVRFRLALREWLEHERSDDYLIDGVRLAEAQRLAAQADLVVAEASAREFIERSTRRDAEERERELSQARALAAEQLARARESARSAARLRRWLVATALAGLVALVAAVSAAVGFIRANEQSRINGSRELALQAQALLATDPQLSILLAREAYRMWSTPQANDVLRSALARSPAEFELREPNAAIIVATLSRDGRQIVTGSSGGIVTIWDAATGAAIRQLPGGSGPVIKVGFSPDGQRVFAASSDRTGSMWDSDGRQIARLNAGAVTAMAWGTSLLALGTSDGTLRLVDGSTGVERIAWPAHQPPIASIALSADGSKLISGSSDQSAIVWDVPSARRVSELRGHRGAIVSVDLDADGKRALTGSQDGSAMVWDALTGSRISVLQGDGAAMRSAVFGPDGRLVLTSSSDGTARIWDATSGHQVQELRANRQPLQMAAFSATGDAVITASSDQTGRVWDAATGVQLLALVGHTHDVRTAEISRDGRTALTTSLDGTARTWQLESRNDWLELVGHTAQVYTAAFNPAGPGVVSGGLDNQVIVWSPPSPRSITTFGQSSAITSLAIGPDGKSLAIAMKDGTARIMHGQPRDIELSGHQGAIYTVTFSPDGKQVLTASADGTARVWSADTGQVLAQLAGGGSEATSAMYSPDGQKIATSTGDGLVRVWDANTRQVVRELRGHVGAVHRVAFSADGTKVISGGADTTVRVWDISSGQEVKKLTDHTGAVYSVDVSSDGQLLISGSADRSAIVWDTSTWQRVVEMRGSTGDVYYAGFSPDQQHVVLASEDGTVRLYQRAMFAP